MSEDSRLSEIRAVLDDWRDPDQVLEDIREIIDRPAPAPRVWFTGETVPRGAAAMNEDGDLVAGAYRVMAIDGPQVELATLSPGEWRAAVDRARDARADAEWQHTEGTTS